MQDYQRILDGLYGLRNFLQQLQEGLETQLNAYRSHITNMIDAGVAIQVAEKYEEVNFRNNENIIRQIINSILEDDIPYINNQIQIIENALKDVK